MRTLSEILIEVDLEPTPINRIAAWGELVKNKYKYPLVELEFAREYLNIKTHDGIGDVAPYAEDDLLNKYKGVSAAQAGAALRKVLLRPSVPKTSIRELKEIVTTARILGNLGKTKQSKLKQFISSILRNIKSWLRKKSINRRTD